MADRLLLSCNRPVKAGISDAALTGSLQQAATC